MKKLILILVTFNIYSQTINLKKDNGVFYTPVILNNIITIDMMIDTGAAECSIPPCVANTLIKTNTLIFSDILPSQNYILADGTIVTCKRFILKSLKIGNRTLYNIECSVSSSDSSGLILGSNVFKKLKFIKLNYINNTLTIYKKKRFKTQ